MSKILVNFGGKVEAGKKYVHTLTDIVATPGVVASFKGADKFLEEMKGKMLYTPGGVGNKYHEMLTPEQTEAVKNFTVPELTSQAGKKYKPNIITDEILFIFTNDETGSETGKYDFAFGLYPGFRPDNNFKAFLQTTKGIDAATLGGKKDLSEIYKIGIDKFVLETKPELREGKWAQIDRTKITPYTPGMQLSTETSTGGDVSEQLFEIIKTTSVNPIELMNIAENREKLGDSATVRKAYNTLKTAGRIKVENNVVVTA